MSKLIIQSDDKESVYELKKAVTSVGRDDTNDIRVNDPSVSSRHFRIEKTDTGYTVIDLGGRNGTRVNGKKIKEHILKAEDKIEVGRTVIYFGSTPAPFDCCVQVLNGSQKGKDYDLKEEICTLGRNQSCVVMVHDDSVSNFHAAIERQGSKHVIRDLHSRNGTSVNGQPVGEQPTVLSDGVEILLGNSRLIFRELVPIEGIEPAGAARSSKKPVAAAWGPAPARQGGAAVEAPAAAPRDDLATAVEEAKRERVFRPRRRSFIKNLLGGIVFVAVIGGVGYAILTMSVKQQGGSSGSKGGDLLEGHGSFIGGKAAGWEFQGENQQRWKVEESSLVAQPVQGPIVSEAVCNTVIDVDRSKSYAVSCKLKADGETGLSGLKMIWTNKADPGYRFEMFSNLVAGKSDWREVDGIAAPPEGAAQLQVACVAVGNPQKVHFNSISLRKEPRPGYSGDEGQGGVGMGISLAERGIITVSRRGQMVLWDVELRMETAQKAVLWQRYCDAQPKQPQAYSSVIRDPVGLTPVDFHVMMEKDPRGGRIVVRYTVRARQKLAMKAIGASFFIRKSDIAKGVLVGQDLGGFVKEGEFNASNVSEIVCSQGEKRIVVEFSAPVEVARSDVGEAARFWMYVPVEVLDADEEVPFEFYLKTSSRLADGEVDKLAVRAAAAATANEVGEAIRLYTDMINNPFFPDKDRDNAKKEVEKLRAKVKALVADVTKSVDAYVADPKKENEDVAKGKLLELKTALAEERSEGDQGVSFVIVPEFRPLIKEIEEKFEQSQQEKVAKAEVDVKKLLENAKKAIAGESWMIARVFLENVVKRSPDSEEAKEAKKLMESMRKNEERANARNEWIERKVTEAKNYNANKMPDRAIKILEDVIQKYPDAAGTKRAIKLLEQIKKAGGK